MKKAIRDNHVHFTGSLPARFILSAIRNSSFSSDMNLEGKWNALFPTITVTEILKAQEFEFGLIEAKFKKSLLEMFGKDKRKNYEIFFLAYSVFQNVCSKAYKNNSNQLYKQGTVAILENNISSGITGVELIAGPKQGVVETANRIDAMMEGIKEVEERFEVELENVIRLTFIRDTFTNTITNYSDEVLEFLLQKYTTDSKFERVLSGFDFSGKEDANDSDTVLSIINKIRNSNFSYKSKKRLKISVHCGEDFFSTDANCSLNFIREIIESDIDRICHGTILWIPDKYLAASKINQHQRESILRQIADKKVEFELCPTANLKITPLGSYNEVNTDILIKLGIPFTINTDNQTLFSTMLSNEYDNLKGFNH